MKRVSKQTNTHTSMILKYIMYRTRTAYNSYVPYRQQWFQHSMIIIILFTVNTRIHEKHSLTGAYLSR